MLYMLFLFVVFFFFKQKTAYEMRISDWSSDVCSSDLPSSSGSNRRSKMRFATLKVLTMCALSVAVSSCGSRVETHLEFPPVADLKVDAEIGRASCRERVCQYV